MNEKKRPVYTFRAFRYGVTNGFTTMLTTMASTYWSLFLVDAVGIATAVMALILSVGNTVDLISVPIVGVVMQKVRFKKGGKFRPWLISAGLIAALMRWLSFTDLGLTGTGAAIWFGGTYILTYIAFNFAYTAFTGLMPVMAKDPQDRVSFASTRTLCNSAGKFVFSLTSVGLIQLFGQGNDKLGYSLLALVIALLVSAAFIQLFFASKNDDVTPVESADGKSGAKDEYDVGFFQMLKNTLTKPFVLYILGASCKGTVFMIITGLSSFYYKYVIGDMSLFTWYMTATTFMMMGGSFLAPFVSRLLKSSRNTYVLGIAIYGGFMGLAFFFGRSALSFTVFMSIAYIGYSFAHSVEVAIYSNVVDYSQWKGGKDLKPFMMSLFSLVPKIGQVVGAAIYGYGLVAVGFNADAVTPEAQQGIHLLITALPAIIIAIGVVIFLFFPLTDNKVREMQQDMARQKAEAEAAAKNSEE